MSNFSLKVSLRERGSKSALSSLRAQGFVPGVVYGGRDAVSISVQIPLRPLQEALAMGSQSAFLTLEFEDGRSYLAIPRDIQYGHIKRDLRHIDFMVVESDQEVRTMIPVHIVGSSDAPLQYGLLEIELSAKPADMPPGFEVDVSELAEGDTIYVRDLVIPAGVELLSNEEEMVVSIITRSAVIEEGEDEDEEAEGSGEEPAGPEL